MAVGGERPDAYWLELRNDHHGRAGHPRRELGRSQRRRGDGHRRRPLRVVKAGLLPAHRLHAGIGKLHPARPSAPTAERRVGVRLARLAVEGAGLTEDAGLPTVAARAVLLAARFRRGQPNVLWPEPGVSVHGLPRGGLRHPGRRRRPAGRVHIDLHQDRRAVGHLRRAIALLARRAWVDAAKFHRLQGKHHLATGVIFDGTRDPGTYYKGRKILSILK